MKQWGKIGIKKTLPQSHAQKVIHLNTPLGTYVFMEPTCAVVRNAFHTTRGGGWCKPRKEPQVVFKRLVPVASDKTVTTYNKEIHDWTAPDQDDRTEDAPNNSDSSPKLWPSSRFVPDLLFSPVFLF